MDRTRRGGGGVEMGGDACVALAGGGKTRTGTGDHKGLHGEVFWGRIVAVVGAEVGWMGSGDACVAQGGGARRSGDQDEGDAQHKASPPRATQPPPLRVWSCFQGVMIKNLPV
jgi:hypothetical protein